VSLAFSNKAPEDGRMHQDISCKDLSDNHQLLHIGFMAFDLNKSVCYNLAVTKTHLKIMD